VILSHRGIPALPRLLGGKPPVEGLYLPLCHGVKRACVKSSFEPVGEAEMENEHVIRCL